MGSGGLVGVVGVSGRHCGVLALPIVEPSPKIQCILYPFQWVHTLRYWRAGPAQVLRLLWAGAAARCGAHPRPACQLASYPGRYLASSGPDPTWPAQLNRSSRRQQAHITSSTSAPPPAGLPLRP